MGHAMMERTTEKVVTTRADVDCDAGVPRIGWVLLVGGDG